MVGPQGPPAPRRRCGCGGPPRPARTAAPNSRDDATRRRESPQLSIAVARQVVPPGAGLRTDFAQPSPQCAEQGPPPPWDSCGCRLCKSASPYQPPEVRRGGAVAVTGGRSLVDAWLPRPPPAKGAKQEKEVKLQVLHRPNSSGNLSSSAKGTSNDSPARDAPPRTAMNRR